MIKKELVPHLLLTVTWWAWQFMGSIKKAPSKLMFDSTQFWPRYPGDISVTSPWKSPTKPPVIEPLQQGRTVQVNWSTWRRNCPAPSKHWNIFGNQPILLKKIIWTHCKFVSPIFLWFHMHIFADYCSKLEVANFIHCQMFVRFLQRGCVWRKGLNVQALDSGHHLDRAIDHHPLWLFGCHCRMTFQHS